MKILIPLSFLLALVVSACGKIKDPEFRRVENFGVKSFGIEKVDIGLNVTYYNPNNFGVSVKEAGADFYIDSVYMGKFTQDQEIEVAKKSEFSVPLSGSIPLATALKLKINDLVNRDLLLQANGSVKVGKAGVFISRPLPIRGNIRLTLNYKKIQRWLD
jgi:LEA14-like dessication related protein